MDIALQTYNSGIDSEIFFFLMQFYSIVSPKIDALNMDPKFLDRNVNEGFSGGERKRNEMLQLSVRYCNFQLAWHLGLYLGLL